MKTQAQIARLMKARQRLERKLKELDAKIEHVLFRINEEKRCFARKCPLEDDDIISELLK